MRVTQIIFLFLCDRVYYVRKCKQNVLGALSVDLMCKIYEVDTERVFDKTFIETFKQSLLSHVTHKKII